MNVDYDTWKKAAEYSEACHKAGIPVDRQKSLDIEYSSLQDNTE